MTANHTELFNGSGASMNASSVVPAQFSYDSMELFYQHRLPNIMAVNRYFTIVWYVVGFPGNLLALAVWIQPRMRHSSGCYLAALATTDFLFLMLHLVLELQTSWDVSKRHETSADVMQHLKMSLRDSRRRETSPDVVARLQTS